MEIQTIPLGPLGANCYIVSRGGACIVADPGGDGPALRAALSGKSVAAVLLTHSHFDHTGGVAALLAETDAPLYCAAADRSLPRELTGPLPENFRELIRETKLSLGGLTVQVLPTPGHSPGSVCLLVRDGAQQALLSGDTLFQGSIGRTDFPGGDLDAMRRSLAQLSRLPAALPVLPGHGPATTIGDELRHNPFLRPFAAGGN